MTEAIGFRLWHVRDGVLQSVMSPVVTEWPVDDYLQAECRKDYRPLSTHWNHCSCGIYACPTLRDLLIFGSVYWGHGGKAVMGLVHLKEAQPRNLAGINVVRGQAARPVAVIGHPEIAANYGIESVQDQAQLDEMKSL